MINTFTRLINKIERDLGLIQITPFLPKEYNKDKWVDIIKEDTLLTFSYYYPRKIKYMIDKDTTIKKGDVYLLKEELLGGAQLTGVADIDFSSLNKANMLYNNDGGGAYFTNNNPFIYGLNSYNPGMFDTMTNMIGAQLNADSMSMFKYGIYPDFIPPNGVIIKGNTNRMINLDSFVIDVYVTHIDISTIAPTKMIIVDQLATCDIAGFLYNNLKYYEEVRSIFGESNIRLDDLRSVWEKRPDIISELESSYVSPSNDNIPYILTVR